MELLHICAPNTPSGNPNRLYVAIQDGAIIDGWDEGYKGIDAVPFEFRRCAVRIDVKAAEVAAFRKQIAAVRQERSCAA